MVIDRMVCMVAMEDTAMEHQVDQWRNRSLSDKLRYILCMYMCADIEQQCRK